MGVNSRLPEELALYAEYSVPGWHARRDYGQCAAAREGISSYRYPIARPQPSLELA